MHLQNSRATTPLVIGSKREEIQAMFKEAIKEYGKIDVLVNNAGIARDGLMVRMKPEQWQQVRFTNDV